MPCSLAMLNALGLNMETKKIWKEAEAELSPALQAVYKAI